MKRTNKQKKELKLNRRSVRRLVELRSDELDQANGGLRLAARPTILCQSPP